MKALRIIALILITSIYLLTSYVPKVHAITPPLDDPFYEDLFGLFAFIPPPKFKVYENMDRLRRYEDLEVCDMDWDDLTYSKWLELGHGTKKENECFDDSVCDKQQVNLCYKGTKNIARTENANGSCRRNTYQEEHELPGKCSYKGMTKVQGNLTATDFSSKITSSFVGTTNTITGVTDKIQDLPVNPPPNSSLTYPKYQNGTFAYSYIGSDNAITWGSHNLALSLCDQAARQMIVLAKARQTKQTLHKFGAWPIGWVDYEFLTPNGKTLDKIFDEIVSADPGSNLIVGPTLGIIQSLDNFYISVGEKSEDVSGAYTRICDTVTKHKDETWIQDLLQSPMYPPSDRHGTARGSICVWNICWPNPGIEAALPNRGNAVAFYVDSSIHATYAAALDDLFLTYPLDQAIDIYKTLAFSNPALRYALVATEQGLPLKVYDALINEGVKTHGPADFTIGRIGHVYDYQQLMDSEGYKIQPVLSKETAGAVDVKGVNVINYLYYKMIDSADDIHRHLITIPELMGQSITELQDAVYQTLDSSIDVADPYRTTISNIVDNTREDHFYSGENSIVYKSKRGLAYFGCSDPMYSSPNQTSIEAYALNTRIDCNGKSNASDISSTPDSSGICGVAAKYNVPCCMLAGIWSVETDKSANIPKYSRGGYKCCNSIGACGATQIMQGLVPPLSNGQNLNPCKEEDSFTLTARMLNIKKCQLAGGCQDNKWTPEVSRKYPIKDSDLAIAGMYYGTNNCAPDQFTQERWGEGKSYCDAVKDYMTNKCVEKSASSESSPTPVPLAQSGLKSSTSRSPTATLPETCGEGIQTALGCLPFTRDAFVSTLLSFVVGISGAIALVTMLIATIQIMTAAGNTEAITKGKELFTSALAGLLFLIFSASLLHIIAGNIIKIPGFGG